MSGQSELWTPRTHLPPPEYRLINPDEEKLPTPVDTRGLVDRQTLVKTVLGTLHPEYISRLSPDTHHLYWPCNRYPSKRVERQFREIPVNKIMLPRDFHGWLHWVTLPPLIPDEGLMDYQVRSYDESKNVFQAARKVVQLQREKDRLTGKLPRLGTEGTVRSRQIGIANNRREFERSLERLQSIPPEARIIEVDTSSNLKEIANKVAIIALRPLVHFDSLVKAA